MSNVRISLHRPNQAVFLQKGKSSDSVLSLPLFKDAEGAPCHSSKAFCQLISLRTVVTELVFESAGAGAF